MKNPKILVYDGSFNGFLTVVFKAFDEKLMICDIQRKSDTQRGLFSDTETVITKMDIAKRVWNGIDKRSNVANKNIYFAFLSETNGIELLLYRYIRKLFLPATDNVVNYTDDCILKIDQYAKMVSREKNHLEAFVKFNMTKDNVYFVNIDPNFNILPLISKHFRSRYPHQQWIIYDVKRKYGLYYNGESVELMALNTVGILTKPIMKMDTFSLMQHNYQELFNGYLRDLEIKQFITQKLYGQPTPKQYSDYLNEKRAV